MKGMFCLEETHECVLVERSSLIEVEIASRERQGHDGYYNSDGKCPCQVSVPIKCHFFQTSIACDLLHGNPIVFW